jgi:intein/homing endonuclease
MTWDLGNQKPLKREPVNQQVLELEGYLEDVKAKIWLYKFLKENVTFTTELLTGIELFPFQHMAVKAMMENDYFLGIWSRGMSKCSHYESLVWSERGLKKIIDLNIGDKVYTEDGSLQKVINKTINDEDKTYKITTQHGFISEGLDYHRVLVLTKDLEKVWKFSKDIAEGEYLICRKNFGLNKIQKNIFDGFKFQNDVKNNNKPKELNIYGPSLKEWYYFFGLLIGDGCMLEKPYGVSITSIDEETKTFLSKFCERLNIHLSKMGNNKDFRLYSKELYFLLTHLGFKKVLAYEKIIPEILLDNSQECLTELIKGLFDTDGYASITRNKKKNSITGRIGFTSTSKTLANQVHNLLLQFSIVGTNKISFKGGVSKFQTGEHECRKAWSVRVTNSLDVRAFYEKIGFNINRKQAKLKELLDNKTFEPCEYLPLVGCYLAKLHKAKSKEGVVFTPNMSKLKIKQAIDRELLEKDLEWVLEDNLFLSKVESIEESKAVTVDITVENKHCYISDGIVNHNSFSTGIFALLDACLNQGVHIGIISKSFRQSKMIFRKIEDIAQDKKAELFQQCIGKVSKSNDEWSMQIGKSRITALPLGDGEKLRGFRFQRIIIDELLLMPEKVLNEVIMPFLAVVENPTERQRIKDAEDAMIEAGKMTEEERTEWPSNKMIGLSSASYKFEYLYKMYQAYENMIFNPGAKNQGRRCIMQFSYDCAPKALYDENLISQARGTMSQSQIDREFNAQFTDDSAGYFKISKMAECTIEDGESPAVEVAGEEGAEYILAFDPSWSESETSDDFAIQVIKLLPEEKKGVVVHSYALPGTNLKKHIIYFKYLLDHFNIIMIVGDYNGGVQFINSCNESDIFKKEKLEIGVFEAGLDNPHEYVKDLKEARRNYNLSNKKICHSRKSVSVWTRSANEMLQTAFDRKKLYFAATAMDDNYSMQKAKKIPIKDLKFSKYEDEKNVGAKMIDFIEHQKDMIDLTKAECALIQVSTSAGGTQSFDLPSNLKRQKGVDRPRKDSYSALVLGNWGMNIYYDMMNVPEETNHGFTPMFI